MLKTSIDTKNTPLPLYSINWEKPELWEENVARLQRKYLNDRGDDGPRDLFTTLSYLEHLTYSLRLFNDREDELVQALCWAALGLEDLYLIFHDRLVTEAFCNEIGTQVVISHRKYGRCLTNQLFSFEMWTSLKIRAEYDSGKPLVPLSPALKLSFSSVLGNMRISLQIPPLTPNSPSFSVRRLPSYPISLEDLVSQNQISDDLAQLLLDATQQRQNIVIAGEPGSGKTTLANALLLKTSPNWRLIIMEDASEIIIPSSSFPMVTRYYMPAVGDDNRYSKRADEIARLLHRSPDYVFLGELQNKDDTKVAFEGFSAGIHGMATTHASSLEGLLSRWTSSHELDKGLLLNIHMIVFTSREIDTGILKLSTEGVYIQNDNTFQRY